MSIAFEPRQVIGPYTLEKPFGLRLGSEAWKARNEEGESAILRLVRDPEIQIILREQSVYLESLQDFEPPEGIVSLLSCNPYADPPYTAERFLESRRPLRSLLRDISPLPLPLAVAIFRDVAQVMGRLHSAGKQHGALRPENVLVSDDGKTLVCGLGWGRIATTMLRRNIISLEKEPADIVAYFAPEQGESAQGFAPPADFYSLGVLLHELTTGRLPPKGDPFSSEFFLGLPDSIQDALRGLLETEVKKRLSSIEDLIEMLPSPADLESDQEEDGRERMADFSEMLRLETLARPHALKVEATKVVLPPPYPLEELTGEASEPQEIDEFWISSRVVSAQQFALFLREADSTDVARFARIDHFSTVQLTEEGFSPQRGLGHFPATSVSFAGAKAYCAWLSLKFSHPFRLPTLAEWLAAAGTPLPDSPRWPWGSEEPDETRVCFERRWSEKRFDVLEPADEPAAGRSPCGAIGMSGNVWEWTSTSLADLQPDDAHPDSNGSGSAPGDLEASRILYAGLWMERREVLKVVAGGSWFDTADEIEPRRPKLIPATFRRITVGFRVASSEEPQ